MTDAPRPDADESAPSAATTGPADVRRATGVPTSVPPGEQPAGRCDRCGRPFVEERALALHRGEVHDSLTDDERAAYEAARDEEADDLFFFHIRVVVALGVMYAMGVVLYMVVLGNNWA